MPALPGYVCVQFADYSESFDPSVLRTEMERGVPKQRLLNSQVLVKINASLAFLSAADAAAFEDWYFDTIKRIGWFTMAHPRTGATITARLEGGNIGALVPLATQFAASERQLVIEYLR